MKNRLSIIALALIATLVSCEKMEMPEIAPAAEQKIETVSSVKNSSISFATAWTKAIADNSIEILRNGGISVFATASNGSASSTEFNNEHLTYASGSNYWSYANEKYWKEGFDYDFFAVSPYTENYYNYANNTVSFNAETSYSQNNQKDWMATRVHTSASAQGDVNLTLQHCAASLQFTFNNNSDCDLEIESATLTGLYTKGTCTISTSGINWSNVNTKASGTAFKSDKQNFTVTKGSSNIDLYSNRIIVVPQNVSNNTDITFTVVYKDKGATSSTTVSKKLSEVANPANWEKGGNYIYNFSITSDNMIVCFVQDIDGHADNANNWITLKGEDVTGVNCPVVGQTYTLTAYIYKKDSKNITKVMIGGKQATKNEKVTLNGREYIRYTAEFTADQSGYIAKNIDVYVSSKLSKTFNYEVPVYSINKSAAKTFIENGKYYLIENTVSQNGYLYATSSTLSNKSTLDYSNIFSIKDNSYLYNINQKKYAYLKCIDFAGVIYASTIGLNDSQSISGYSSTSFIFNYSNGSWTMQNTQTKGGKHYITYDSRDGVSMQQSITSTNKDWYWNIYEVICTAPTR